MKKKLFFNLFFVIILPFYNAQNYTIKQIDSLVAYATDFSRKTPGKAIPLNEKNYEISKKANYLPGMIKSSNMISLSYSYMGNYERGLYYAKQTEKLASEINDYKNICNALRISALSYSQVGLYTESQEMMTNAFSLVDKITNPDDFYETRGNLYLTKIDIMAYYGNGITIPILFEDAKKSISDFSKIKNIEIRNNSLGLAYSNLGIAYVEKKRFDSAYHYMNKSLDLALIEKNPYNECVALNGLVYASILQKKYQQAINYLKVLIPLAKKSSEPSLLKLAYHSMEQAYDHLGNREKKLEYLAKYTKLDDSLTTADKLTKKVSVQKIVKEKEEAFIGEKEKLYLLIAFVCLLSVLTCYFGYKAFINYKQERKKIQHRENVIGEKESQLIELKQKVNNAFDEVVDLAKNNDPVFLARFQEVYPDVIKKLLQIDPQLQASELKFCAFLFLNFSSKDIAEYTFVRHESIQKRKNRLRKKLGIPTEEDIYLWMKNLNN